MKKSVNFRTLHSALSRCVRVSGPTMEGSGVIVIPGIVFTAMHLLDGKGDIFVDGVLVKEDVWFPVPKVDFAVLRVETKQVRPVVIQSKIRSGQRVFYVGNPGNRTKAIELGYIKSNCYWQYEVSIDCEDGFCGSGLYNGQGELVGIMDSSDCDDPKRPNIRNIGYAIPGLVLQQYHLLSVRKLKLATG